LDHGTDRSIDLAAEALVSGEIERTYYPTTAGFIFATSGLIDHIHLPFYGMIVLSVESHALDVRVGSRPVRHEALALWARNVRFNTSSERFISIGVNPLHRDFRAFTRLASPHVISLDPKRYLRLRPLMQRAIDGDLTPAEAAYLFDAVLEATRASLPPVPPFEARAETLMRLLWEQPRCSLAEMAESIGVSYHRASHAFVQAVGVPTRTYQLWQKLYRSAAPLLAGRSLTEVAQVAGFVDSAHYSRTFQHAYGRCPTEMFRTRRIEVFCKGGFSEAAVVHSRK
jgi:AraC-like DNA-binding protein